MKFERNNLNFTKKVEPQVEPTPVEEAPADLNIAENTPEVTVTEAVVETTVAAVEETPTVAEEVKTEPTQESLTEKFKIPEFDPKAFPKAPQGIFTRVNPPQPAPTVPETHVEVKINTEAIKGIDLVDEVPEGESVVDGVEMVGEHAPRVEEKLEADLVVAKEELAAQHAPIPSPPVPEGTGKCDKCGAPEHLCTREETPIEEPAPAPVEEEKVADTTTEPQPEGATKTDEPTKQDAWDKFVDFVIVPTLLTCIDRAKDYIQTVLSYDLKKNNPDV